MNGLAAMLSLPIAQVATQTVETSQWQLQANWPWAPWLTVLLVVAAVAGVVWLYAREASPAGAMYRTLLIVLRLTALALVLVMLSGLLLSATRQGQPRLVVLVDRSASMELATKPSNASRLTAVQDWLLQDEGEVLRAWNDNYALELRSVADGDTNLTGEDFDQLLANLRNVEPTGPVAARSRLGDAVATALDPQQGVPPAAIVLATDGRTTAGRSLDEARELARERGVPIFALGLGSASPPPDLRLSDLLADDTAMAGDLLAMGVTVEATNLAGETLRVVAKNLATGQVEAEQTLTASAPQFSQQVKLLVLAGKQGRADYQIEVEPAAEERDTQNNRLTHSVEIRDEKVKVLLAAGYPNYEFRYLKALLDRDTTFQLASYLQEADLDYASQDASAIAQLPLEADDLDSFDVVVLIDLNPRLLPPTWWRNVERHVYENRGGLVLVAGPRYFPWLYGNVETLGKLAPIDIQGLANRLGQNSTGYQLQITPLGAQTATMQLGTSVDQSQEIWRGLSSLYWYADPASVKPSATVLATHPSATLSDGRPLPVILSQYVGSGRVLYHGFDSSWRWRFRVGDVFFARYWGQTLRYLARAKVLAGEQQPEILVENSQYQSGEPIRVRLQLGGANAAAASTAKAELLVESENQPRQRVELSPSQLSGGLLQGTLRNLAPGRYRLTVGEPVLQSPPPAVEFVVEPPPGEMADITMNEAGLRDLAEATYGKFYTLDQIGNLASDLPAGQQVPLEVLPPYELWNQWWMLLAITGCLSAEWILRKRRAML